MEDNIVEVDWIVFKDEWRRYKRSCLSQATPEEVADQLKSFCSKALMRSIFSQNRPKKLFNHKTDEDKILLAIREVAVNNTPKKIDDFLRIVQRPEENIDTYAARLTSASLSCNFELPAGQTNYTEPMIKHQLIKGLFDKEIRIQTIQTISKKEHVSLVETLNVIKIKKSAKDEAVDLKPNIKAENLEEPDTTQMDIMIDNEIDSHYQLLQPPRLIHDSSTNHITNKNELYNNNLLLAPPSPTPSTVSTIPFSPCQLQKVSGNLVDEIKEENVELKERITNFEEVLAGKSDTIRGMQEKHSNEIIVLELQLKLKSEAMEHMISTAHNDSKKYETKINSLQEKEKDNKIQSELMKNKMLLSQRALKQMQVERTNSENALEDVIAEKEVLRTALKNNLEEQRQTQQDHNGEMEKITVQSIIMQTKLDEYVEQKNLMKVELQDCDMKARNAEKRMLKMEEENTTLKALNETKERAVSIQKFKSPKRKQKESTQKNVTKKKRKYEGMHEHNSEYIVLVIVDSLDILPDVQIRVKPTIHMLKLKKAYSERTGVSISVLEFCFKSQEIKDIDTPQELSMSHNDTIYVTNMDQYVSSR